MTTERNRTVARFTHDGQRYKIHERRNQLGSDGSWFTRRFIIDAEGRHHGEANNIREARALLYAKLTAKS